MRTILRGLLEDRRLLVFRSQFVDGVTPRMMYVTPGIENVTRGPFGDLPEDERLAEFAAWLESFVEFGEVTVAEDPHNKPPDVMLARVDPVEDEFWSIRVTDPDEYPGIRALGAFVAHDEFAALTWDYRESIADDFDGEVEEVRAQWKALFGAVKPFSGGKIDEYLSNARPI
ncbi:MAG: hypothetical protein APF80_14820 [Alphaproteobacteria bacterium BRH_c36]|nr:MAG: hypothetical protein APF80_14820 [Alphaproteobacteria bacterium BRH_c36]